MILKKALTLPTAPSKTAESVIIYDGSCNLCNFWVEKILKYSPNPPFQLVSFYSSFGKDLFQKFATDPTDFSTMLYLRGETVFEKSDAVIEIGKDLGGAWRLLATVKWVPKRIRDSVYSAIAKNRYKLMGPKKACPTRSCGAEQSIFSQNLLEKE